MAFSRSLERKIVSVRNLVFICSMAFICLMLGSCSKSDLSAPQKILPNFVTQANSVYTLKLDLVEMNVDAALAGRINSLKIKGQEILVRPQDIKTSMWGNGFWTSPQNEWLWPPLVTLDSAPYSVTIEPNHLIFTSKIEEKTRYQFIKKYGIDSTKKAFTIHYTIINHSTEEKRFGAWEVTRVKPRGHVFFPQGEGETFSGMFYPLDVVTSNGITWFDYDPTKIKQNHHKLMTDGKEGWVAYSDQRFVLIKAFTDVPQAKMIPGEAEIGIFASHEKDYLEIAEQGEYTSVPAGGKIEWEVLWYLENLPDAVDNSQANPELISFVRSVLANSASHIK